jgi:hypothetical protein
MMNPFPTIASMLLAYAILRFPDLGEVLLIMYVVIIAKRNGI